MITVENENTTRTVLITTAGTANTKKITEQRFNFRADLKIFLKNENASKGKTVIKADEKI